MREEFFSFLKKHRALRRWRRNLGKGFESYDFDDRRWIRSAFDWTDTPEGIDYWDHLDDKWIAHLEELKRGKETQDDPN